MAIMTSFVSHLLPMQAVLGKKLTHVLLRCGAARSMTVPRVGKTWEDPEFVRDYPGDLGDTYGISSHLEEIKDFQVALMELCCGWRQSALEPKCSCFVEAKGWSVLEGHGQIAVQSSMWTLVV